MYLFFSKTFRDFTQRLTFFRCDDFVDFFEWLSQKWFSHRGTSENMPYSCLLQEFYYKIYSASKNKFSMVFPALSKDCYKKRDQFLGKNCNRLNQNYRLPTQTFSDASMRLQTLASSEKKQREKQNIWH